jgi:hypothetical protein
MKKILTSFALAFSLIFAVTSCDDTSNKMDKDYPSDYDIKYALKQVIEKDPVNINGIDVYPYFDFFQTYRLTIHYKSGKISSIEFINGDIPFSTYSFPIPSGETECYYNTESTPNTIRLKGSDDAVVYFGNGELYVPFKLDCKDLTYEYRFKEIKE